MEPDPKIEGEARQIFDQVLSPFCPGRSLHDCPSSAATELKNEIREKVASGTSREDILADLYARYGDEIQAVPGMQGFGFFAWAAPAVFLIGGSLWGIKWLKSRTLKTNSDPAVQSEVPLNAELRRKIEQELK